MRVVGCRVVIVVVVVVIVAAVVGYCCCFSPNLTKTTNNKMDFNTKPASIELH